MSADPDVRAFFDDHCAKGGVILVIVIGQGDAFDEKHGVFSSFEAAEKWRASHGSDGSAVFVPKYVDDPEWGNRETH